MEQILQHHKPGITITIKIIIFDALTKQFKYVVIENVIEDKVDRVNYEVNIELT